MKLITINFVAIILFTNAENHELNPVSFRNSSESNLWICAEKILKIYGNSSNYLAYSNNTYLVNKIAKLLVNLKITKLEWLNETLPKILIDKELVVIIFENTKVLNYYLQSITSYIETFIKVFLIYNGKEEIDSIFEITWRYYLVKVILVDNLSNVYSYKPYETSCKLVKSKYLYNCLDEDLNLGNLFSFEMTSFNNCTITALTIKNPPYVIDVTDPKRLGYEAFIFDFAAKLFKFNLNFTLNNFTKWGYENPDENYTDAIKFFVENKEIDILFGRLPANYRLLADFETTATYLHSVLAVYVPKAKQVGPTKNLMLVFDWKVFVLSFFSALTLNIVVHILNFLKKDSTNQLSCVNIFAITSSQPVILHKPISNYSRYFFVILVLYTMVFTCSYNSVLMSFLTKPNFEKQIETLEELGKSELKLGGDYYAKYLAPTTPDFQKKNWTSCPSDNEGRCIMRVILQKDMAIIEDTDVVRYYLKKAKLKDLRSSLHRLKGNQYDSFIWAIIRKGHPLGRMINKLIDHINEHGYESKWKNYYQIRIVPETQKFKVVGIKHLLIPFGVAIGGLVCSCFAFLCELRRFYNMQLNANQY